MEKKGRHKLVLSLTNPMPQCYKMRAMWILSWEMQVWVVLPQIETEEHCAHMSAHRMSRVVQQ
jgi:hypothetical protein